MANGAAAEAMVAAVAMVKARREVRDAAAMRAAGKLGERRHRRLHK